MHTEMRIEAIISGVSSATEFDLGFHPSHSVQSGEVGRRTSFLKLHSQFI